MSQVGITTDFIARRDQFNAELRALENDVKQTATRLKGSPLRLNVEFDANQAARNFRVMLQNLQSTASQAPIVVPVVFQPVGGMPGMGGGGGITNVTNVVNQTSNVSNALTGAGGTGAVGGGGAGGGLMRGGGLAMRGLAFYGAHQAISMAREVMRDMTRLDELGNDVNSSNIGSTARGVREIVGRENSGALGFLRRVDPTYNRVYGSPDAQGVGIENTLVDAERGNRRAETTGRGIAEIRTLGNRITGATRGSGAARLAELEQWAVQEERLANDLRAQGQKRLADRISSSAGVIMAIERGRVAAEENALVARTSLQASGIGAEANEAVMRASGRGTEAGFAARARARGERVAHAQISVNAEQDPVRKAQLMRVLQAEQLAAPQEAIADQIGMMRGTTQDMRAANIRATAANLVTAGRPREASLYARNASIDERLRQQREEANATRDPFVRGQLQTRLKADTEAGEAEKRANIAEDWRRTLDAIEQNTIAKDQARLQIARNDSRLELEIFDKQTQRRLRKIEDAEEKRTFIEARAQERRAIQEASYQQHLDVRQQARDIVLRARGKGGLADELDIEDQLRRDVKAAGSDTRARRDATNLARARLEAFIRGSWQPQMFNSFAQFQDAAQMNILNRDGEGLKRAMSLIKRLPGYQKTGDGDAGFGPEDVEKFNNASDKLGKAADKLNQHTLVAVRF